MEVNLLSNLKVCNFPAEICESISRCDVRVNGFLAQKVYKGARFYTNCLIPPREPSSEEAFERNLYKKLGGSSDIVT